MAVQSTAPSFKDKWQEVECCGTGKHCRDMWEGDMACGKDYLFWDDECAWKQRGNASGDTQFLHWCGDYERSGK